MRFSFFSSRASGAVPLPGRSGDRGCVSCGFVIDPKQAPEPGQHRTFLIDARGRYWCADCATEALAHVRRRVDERTKYTYPWRFEDTGGLDGQHISVGAATATGAAPELTTSAAIHILDQSGQPYGSERRCCNHCGVMLWPEMQRRLGTPMPTFTDNWDLWRASPSNCSKKDRAP